MAENDHLPLTWHIALTTVYALTCYTVILIILKVLILIGAFSRRDGAKREPGCRGVSGAGCDVLGPTTVQLLRRPRPGARHDQGLLAVRARRTDAAT